MIRTLEKSHDNIIGFSVSGEINDDEVQTMASRMRDGIAQHGKIRVLARLDGASPKDLLTGLKERVDFISDHGDDVERMALVTDSKAADLFSAVSNVVNSIDIETFDVNEEEKAWAWVE